MVPPVARLRCATFRIVPHYAVGPSAAKRGHSDLALEDDCVDQGNARPGKSANGACSRSPPSRRTASARTLEAVADRARGVPVGGKLQALEVLVDSGLNEGEQLDMAFDVYADTRTYEYVGPAALVRLRLRPDVTTAPQRVELQQQRDIVGGLVA